jgi:predicted dehydrogenase
MSRSHRVAILGAGTLGRAYAAAARSIDWPIVGVVSDDGPAADELAADVDVARIGLGDLVGAGRPEVAVLTAPVEDHAATIAGLLTAGIATLAAPPLAPTLAECRAIGGVVDRRAGHLDLTDHLVASPAVQQLLAGVARLRPPLRHLSATVLAPRPGEGRLDDRCDPSLGGVLFHRGGAALATLLLGARIAGWGGPREVAATIDPSGTDRTVLHIGFGEAGRATLEIAWGADEIPAWGLQAAGDHEVYRAEMHPQPMLELNGTEVHLPGRRLGDRVHPADALGFAPALRLLSADLEARRGPLVDVAAGVLHWELVAAAHASAAIGGETVRLPFEQRLHEPPARIGAP